MTQQWVKVPGDKPYFWNLETQATSWTEPEGVEVVWVVQTTVDGGMYYWNKVTDETSLESPFGAIDAHVVVQDAAPSSGSDSENNPQRANTAVDGQKKVKRGSEGSQLKWRAQRTPEGFFYQANAEGARGAGEVSQYLLSKPEPLASWPHMEHQVVMAVAETVATSKVEPSPMMIVHALKQTDPMTHMVSFTDGRMMLKMPGALGGATLVPMSGSAAELKALSNSRDNGGTVEASDHLGCRYQVKGNRGFPKSSDLLSQSRMWDINRLKELNCRVIESDGARKHLPLNLTSLQVEMINTMDGVSASFLPGCLKESMPFSSCVESGGSFEYSSLEAASSRLRQMKGRGIVAPSVKVAARMLSSTWTPGVVASDWTPYLRPKTLVPLREKTGGRLPGAGQPSLPWWETGGAGAAPGQPSFGAPGGAAAPAGPAKATADAQSQAALLQTLRSTVLDILGADVLEDDTSLMHASVTPIKSVPLSSSLQAMLPPDMGAAPLHLPEIATGFEPPAPSPDGALAVAGAGGGGAAGESEKGCRATATRIRSSASSFYTLMGSTAADYSTMALNVGGPGRGPGLSAAPFTAALSS